MDLNLNDEEEEEERVTFEPETYPPHHFHADYDKVEIGENQIYSSGQDKAVFNDGTDPVTFQPDYG